jgi:hypothetical protein
VTAKHGVMTADPVSAPGIVLSIATEPEDGSSW